MAKTYMSCYFCDALLEGPEKEADKCRIQLSIGLPGEYVMGASHFCVECGTTIARYFTEHTQQGFNDFLNFLSGKTVSSEKEEAFSYKNKEPLEVGDAKAKSCSTPASAAGCTFEGLCEKIGISKYTGLAGSLEHDVYWVELQKRIQVMRERWGEREEAARIAGQTIVAAYDDRDKSVLPDTYDLEVLIRKIEARYAGEVDPIRWNDYWRVLKLRMRKWQHKLTADNEAVKEIVALEGSMEKGAQMFHDVLQRVCTRVFREKGETRHGLGRPLLEQAAFVIRRTCAGFLIGQALKKIMEVQEAQLTEQEKMQELLDAIAYIAFEIVHTSAKKQPRWADMFQTREE